MSVALLTFAATVEYNKLTSLKTKDGVSEAILLLAAFAMPFVFYEWANVYSGVVIFAVVFLFFLSGMLRGRDFKDTVLDGSLKTLGLVYIAWPLSHLVLLKMAGGSMWIFFLLVVIWINDTFALITGKVFGRHKLSPLVSPNKTVEGAVGGVAAGVIAAYIFNVVAGFGMAMTTVLVLPLLIGVVGIIGDLIESVIKRSAGAKDSGVLIPGHGGALDRIDSLLFAIPLLYYYLAWM